MFECIANSHVIFDGIWFTNWNAVSQSAFVQFKSSPNKCYGNTIQNCQLSYGWVSAAILFGSAGTNDSTHWNDNVVIRNNLITRIFNPSYQTIYTDISTSLQCRGIDFNTTTLRALVDGNTITYTAGDGIFANGANNGLKNNPLIGNITIVNNYFFQNFMCVEVLGPYYAKNLTCLYNKFYYPTRNGGYCLSIQGKGKKIFYNDFRTKDRTAIENTGIDDEIAYNTGDIGCWNGDPTTGVANSASVSAICFVESSGFASHVHDNHINEDRSVPNSTTPTQFNAFKIVSRTNGVPQGQDTSYQDVFDLPAYFWYENNTVTGITHYFIDATNEKVRYVYAKNNMITSGVLVQTPIQPYGYGWEITDNTLNTLGSTAPSGASFIKKRSNQTDGAGEIVDGNTIKGISWYNASLANSYYLFRNR